MMPVKKLTLPEQRRALRQQLLVQRQAIATQLDAEAEAARYPRSMTMRFLSGKTVVGTGLIRSVATVLGTGAVKALVGHAIRLLFDKHRQR